MMSSTHWAEKDQISPRSISIWIMSTTIEMNDAFGLIVIRSIKNAKPAMGNSMGNYSLRSEIKKGVGHHSRFTVSVHDVLRELKSSAGVKIFSFGKRCRSRFAASVWAEGNDSRSLS